MSEQSAANPSEGTGDRDVLETAHRARLLQVGTMLGGIVHEIKNPLAVIQGYAQLLRERVADASDRRDLDTIVSESRRMGALIEDMLSFIRRESDVVESVDARRVIEVAVNLTAHDMRQSRVTVTAALPEDPVFVRGQHAAYVQVLLNLLSNARQSLEQKAEGPRGVAIHCDSSPPPGRVHVLVANNGPPIPAEIESTLFEPFVTTKPAGQGTGLGLSLCREILARFEGTIGLERAKEPGSVCFRLDLPRATA